MVVFFIALLAIVLGYLCGSLCSAIIVCRVFALPDPREAGSKNPGATNVLRLAGKKYAAMVLVGDMLKGVVAVLIAKLLGVSPLVVAFTGLAAVVGHMFPIFFDFKGGKGIATALGALLGLNLILGVLAIATWLIVANYSHYSSLASLVSLTLAPVFSLFIMQNMELVTPLFCMTILIYYKHRSNINRLLDGTEPKIYLHGDEIHNLPEELFTTDEVTPDEEGSDSAATTATKTKPRRKKSTKEE